MPASLPHRPLAGFSLVELLVALTLLSVVVVGGFFFFNTVQTGFLEQAGNSNKVRQARANADALFVAFHDNSSFTAAAVSTWPEISTDNDTEISLTSIWGDAGWVDDNGSYRCRVLAVDNDSSSFTVDADCYGDLGIADSDLADALTSNPLPTALIIGASHGCIVSSASTVAGETEFTVSDANCLNDAGGVMVRADAASGAGVVFPRLAIQGQNRASLLESAYFDHFGDNRSGAGLYFGVEEIWRDSSSTRFSLESSASEDNFTSAWANIDDFNDTNALSLINPRGLSGFTLLVEALSADTQVATSNTGTAAAASLFRENQTASALATFLNSLHARRTSTGDAVIRFHLGSGDFVWTRDLRLVIN